MKDYKCLLLSFQMHSISQTLTVNEINCIAENDLDVL